MSFSLPFSQTVSNYVSKCPFCKHSPNKFRVAHILRPSYSQHLCVEQHICCLKWPLHLWESCPACNAIHMAGGMHSSSALISLFLIYFFFATTLFSFWKGSFAIALCISKFRRPIFCRILTVQIYSYSWTCLILTPPVVAHSHALHSAGK